MTRLKIGQVAEQASVGVETIRFYERKGLLAEPPRRPSGYREYPAEAVSRIRFIQRAKGLGFSLAEIGELLDLKIDETSCRSEVKRRAEAKISEIERKVAELERMRQALVEVTAACDGQGTIGGCPILQTLEVSP